MPNSSTSSNRGSSSSNNAAHLARVRENQRRSRARRKEYLNELEENFRKCKERGIEASAEMQQAARKVLEENQRLRMILKAKGMTDEEIERFADDASSSASPPAPVSGPAAELGTMLSRRSSGESQSYHTLSRPSPEIAEPGPGYRHGSSYEIRSGVSGSSSPGGLGPSQQTARYPPSYRAPRATSRTSEEGQFTEAVPGFPAAPNLLESHSPYGMGSVYASQAPGYAVSRAGSSAPEFATAPASYGYDLGTRRMDSRRSPPSDASGRGFGEETSYLSTGLERQHQHSPNPSEIDMSELLPPELEAQFTAVLQGGSFGGPGEEEAPWSYSSHRRW